MAKRVVDFFEAVEVHDQQCQIVPRVDRLLEALVEQHTIRQPGKAVVQRPMCQLGHAVAELLGHAVEGATQIPDLIPAADRRPSSQVTAGHLLCAGA